MFYSANKYTVVLRRNLHDHTTGFAHLINLQQITETFHPVRKQYYCFDQGVGLFPLLLE